MDTLPLPSRPNLDQYRRRAKDLVAAATSNDTASLRSWATDWRRILAGLFGATITPFIQDSIDRAIATIERRVREAITQSPVADRAFTLAEAQHLIARAHGFENWGAFARHVDGRARGDDAAQTFEAAADAIVAGDISTLRSLVHADPDLIRTRSTRVHRATLLHYVAANGVEDFRQKTPRNAVEIARLLLEAGAEVDAVAETYGGGNDQTTMNLLVSSTHPAEIGVQAQLVETLLDFGAAINGLDDDGSAVMTALAFGYRDAAEALARRGARLDNVVVASALGRLDLVTTFVVDAQTLHPGVPLIAPGWLRVPPTAVAHIELAFVWACKFGRVPIAQFLLDKGVSPSAKDSDSMTALHWAAASGVMPIVDRLVQSGAPLEVENRWGGTVLNSTLHFAQYQPVPGVDYPGVIRALIAAGADTSVVDPGGTGNAEIDRLLFPNRSQ